MGWNVVLVTAARTRVEAGETDDRRLAFEAPAPLFVDDPRLHLISLFARTHHLLHANNTTITMSAMRNVRRNAMECAWVVKECGTYARDGQDDV